MLLSSEGLFKRSDTARKGAAVPRPYSSLYLYLVKCGGVAFRSTSARIQVLAGTVLKFSDSCAQRHRAPTVLILACLVMVISGTQAALGGSSNDTDHPSLIAVPSMGEDFVRTPDLNSRDLAQPRPGDYRYMKMNYATSKGDPDAVKDDSELPAQPGGNGKPFPPRGGEPVNNLSPPPGPGSLRTDKLGQIDLAPLSLTQDQKQKIQDMRRETGRKLKDLRKTLKAKRDDLLNATFDPEMTEAAIREKREAVRVLHQQVEDLMFDDLMALRNLLTPEQKKHLAEIKPPPPPSFRSVPPGEGPPRLDSTRVEGTKLDALAKSNIARSDANSKSDSSKALAPKSDASAKSDTGKTAATKN